MNIGGIEGDICEKGNKERCNHLKKKLTYKYFSWLRQNCQRVISVGNRIIHKYMILFPFLYTEYYIN